MNKTLVKKGEIKRAKKVEPSNADVLEVKEDKSTLDIIEEGLERDGIKMFDNANIDKDYLLLPPHLDEEEAREIGRYLHTFTQQRMWVRTLLARVGAIMREENDELDKHRARIFAPLPVRMSITDKELKLYEDELASSILDRIKLISAKYDMLEAYMKNLEDAIFSISREISRRGMDFNSQNRVENASSSRR